MGKWILIIFLIIFSAHLTGEQAISLRLFSQAFNEDGAIQGYILAETQLTGTYSRH